MWICELLSMIVFPTRVGMYRVCTLFNRLHIRFPHTRGDVPVSCTRYGMRRKFSPHAWGCTGRLACHRWQGHRFPHTRGDVPRPAFRLGAKHAFSPHAWGCTGERDWVSDRYHVFPTRVGMYRQADRESGRGRSFPHTRGDVPEFI